MASLTTFQTLSSFQDELDNQLTAGEINFSEYQSEWNDILVALGWSAEQYEREVDRHWDPATDQPDYYPPRREFGSN